MSKEPAPQPSFCLWGLSHKTAPLEARELWALNTSEVRTFLRTFSAKFEGQMAVLSTCNRTELYCHGISKPDLKELTGTLERIKGRKLNPDPHCFYSMENEEAVKHLFQVTSGLESQILGETEIQGQVKEAIGVARRSHTAGSELNRLFERALKAGKRVRHETRISEGVLSAGQAAVLLAEKVLGRLDSARVLVVGSGKTGNLTVQALLTRGIGSLQITSRTEENARLLARRFGGSTLPWSSLLPAVSKTDLIISSTASPAPLFKKEDMESALHGRSSRPVVVIDLAVPRDFAPDTAKLDNVFLHDLDDLEKVLEQSRTLRQDQLCDCHRIVEEEARKFLTTQRFRREVEPLLTRFSVKAQRWRQEEIKRETQELPSQLRNRLDKACESVLNRCIFSVAGRVRELLNTGDLPPEAIRVIKEILQAVSNDHDPTDRNPGK